MSQYSRTPPKPNAFPDGYVRPKRRPPPRERLTISKLLYATTCTALTFFVYPLTYATDPPIIWCLMCGFIGSAVGNFRGGTEGAVFGFIFGLFFIPVAAIVLFAIHLILLFIYLIISGAEPGGLLSDVPSRHASALA